jgi:hypothetical protein
MNDHRFRNAIVGGILGGIAATFLTIAILLVSSPTWMTSYQVIGWLMIGDFCGCCIGSFFGGMP